MPSVQSAVQMIIFNVEELRARRRVIRFFVPPPGSWPPKRSRSEPRLLRCRNGWVAHPRCSPGWFVFHRI